MLIHKILTLSLVLACATCLGSPLIAENAKLGGKVVLANVPLANSQSHRPIHRLHHGSAVTAVEFSPDGALVVSLSSPGNTVKIWNTSTGEELHEFRIHTSGERHARASSVAFIADGKLVAVSSLRAEQPLQFWDVTTGKQVELACQCGRDAFDLAVSPDQSMLALAKLSSVGVWTFPECKKLHELGVDWRKENLGHVAQVVFSPDGEFVAAAMWHYGGMRDVVAEKVRVWNIRNGKRVFAAWKEPVNAQAVAFSSTGAHLAAVGAGDKVELLIWNLNTKKLAHRIMADNHSVSRVAFRPGGTIVVTGGSGPQVKLWDVDSGKQVGEISGHLGGVRDIAFSKDGTLLATAGSDSFVCLWPMDDQATSSTCEKTKQDDKSVR